MTRYHKALGVFLVTVFGLWGCARGPESPGSANATNEKIRILEAKTAKLEDDLRTLAAVKDQLQKKLTDAEQVQALLHQEIDRLQMVVKERDDLKGDLRARTTERDQLQTQFDTFRNTIKDLIGQAEASLPNNKPTAGLVSRQKEGPALRTGDGN